MINDRDMIDDRKMINDRDIIDNRSMTGDKKMNKYMGDKYINIINKRYEKIQCIKKFKYLILYK